jgi:hypothetical protein
MIFFDDLRLPPLSVSPEKAWPIEYIATTIHKATATAIALPTAVGYSGGLVFTSASSIAAQSPFASR